jgi:hypothetical protein
MAQGLAGHSSVNVRLEVLESFHEGKEFETLADVVRACGQADQVPQTGIIDVKP